MIKIMMMNWTSPLSSAKTKRLWFLDILLVTLVAIGLVNLYSITVAGSAWEWSLDNMVLRQFLFLVPALIVYFIIGKLDYNITRSGVVQMIFGGAIVLLLLGLFIFAGIINETKRWYTLGPFLFQPSEYAKIIVVFWVSFWLTTESLTEKKRLLIVGAGASLIMALIFLEPDLGTTIIIGILALAIVSIYFGKDPRLWMVYLGSFLVIVLGGYYYLAKYLGVMPFSWWLMLTLVVLSTIGIGYILNTLGRYWRFLVSGMILVLAILAVVIIGWNYLLQDYQKDRLEVFLGTGDESPQVEESRIAIGSGQLLGRGLGRGSQSRLRFLPEAQTDFMFASFVEQWGLLGGAVLLVLYMILLIRLIYLGWEVTDIYGQLILVGIVVKLWVEVFINLSMNMGILPTKGIPLPLISYGGSSLLSWFILFGIIQSIYQKR